jgi:uncharacterized protein YihD (DUF1040 family)
MTPRDPKRIDRVIELPRRAWHLMPDFRLTQLVMVVSDKPQDAGALWHVEDDGMEQRLRAFIAGRQRLAESQQDRKDG